MDVYNIGSCILRRLAQEMQAAHAGEAAGGHDEGAMMEADGGAGGGPGAILASDNPMENLSLAEFTREMKLDADQQQCLVPIVAKLLRQMVDANDKAELSNDHITVFHAQKAPAVSVIDYAERIAKYSSCSYCCFVVGVIYIDRFIQQQRQMKKDFHVHSLNVHRILLSSVMVAAKFLDDFYYSNEFWAKIGGVPNNELNTLELEFLFMTNFDLHVSRSVYDSYREELLAWEQGQPMTRAHHSIMPWGLLYEIRRIASRVDEVETPPEDVVGGVMEVEGNGGGSLGGGSVSSIPPGEEAETGMDLEE